MRQILNARYWMLLAPFVSGTLWSNVQIVPTPQYAEVLDHSLIVKSGGKVEIVLDASPAVSSPKSRLAAELLKRGLESASAAVQVDITGAKPAGAAIYLWNWETDTSPPLSLNLLDRQIGALEKCFVEGGGLSEGMMRARLRWRKERT